MLPSRLLTLLLVLMVVFTLLTEEGEAVRRRRRRRRRRQREGGVARRGARRIRHAKGRRAEFVRRRLRKAQRNVEGKVRLVDGRGDFEGNVEVWHQGSWGNICDDEWDNQEGEIVCRQLGFPGVDKVTYSGVYGRIKQRYWMDNLFCVGTEKNLTMCNFDGWGIHDCEGDEAAGVICRSHFAGTTPTPTLPPRDQPVITNKTKLAFALEGKLKMRLVGGRTETEGRVEILLPGRRARRGDSDEGVGVTEANHNNKRKSGGEGKSNGESETEEEGDGESEGGNGNEEENNTEDELGNEGGNVNATVSENGEVAGNVTVSRRRRESGDEAGSEEEEEESEVWGLVCGDGWSLHEAMVVCRQLGFGYAQGAVSTGYFGGNTSSLALSGVKCTGNERMLEHCLHDAVGEVFCPHQAHDANIAGVTCVNKMADLVPDHYELARSAHLEDKQLFFLGCAMEENCLAATAKTMQESGYGWHLETRRLLRFTARIVNQGDEAFRPFLPKQYWEWHACHMHYHSMEVFAHYDIIDAQGNRVAEGHKASFCLEDNNCLPGITPTFRCANFGDQGISPGCTDTYAYNIDCQWVDITDLKPGIYTFKLAINPEFKVAEKSFDNNAAVCELIYSIQNTWLGNCTLHRP